MDSWVDGQPADTLSLKDRGLAYGDGLFETIAVRGGQPLLLDRHLSRLAQGCSRLAITADHALVRSELLAYATAMGEGVLKLILTRGDGLRGYAPDPRPRPDAFCKAILRRLILSSMASRVSVCSLAPHACPTNHCSPGSSI